MIANVHNIFPARRAAPSIALPIAAFVGAVLACAALAVRGADAPTPLSVEFSGCAVVLDGPVCVLGEARELRLWISVPTPQSVTVRAGALVLTPLAASNRGSGVLLELDVPPGESRMAVRAGAQQWRLAVEDQNQPAVFAEALGLAYGGDAPAAKTLIERELQHLPANWHGKALRLIGQLHWREGDAESAERYLRASVSASAGAGRRSEALKTATVLTYMLLTNGTDIGGARAVMEAQWAAPADAEGQYDLHYHRGLVAFNAGNARLALRELEQAAAVAGRMHRPLLRSYAESLLAVQLQRIGRHRLAGDLLAKWAAELPADVSPCNRALHLTNMGWSRLLVLESGESGADPMPPLLEALAIAENQCSASDRMNALTNLALAHLHNDQPQQASDYVARARHESAEPALRTVLWLLDIEARIALQKADTSGALAKLDQLDALAAATLSAGARWRAAAGRARVQHAMGDVDSALRSYAAADRLLDDAIFRVPLDAGRETLLTARAWATREHLALLLDAGENAAAFALLRRSRSRVLASLDVTERIAALQPAARGRWEAALAEYRALRQRLDESAGSAWMLPADALARLEAENRDAEARLRRIVDDAVTSLDLVGQPNAAPARPGELLLALHPLPAGWAVFAHDGENLSAHRSDCAQAEDAELAACLLRPLATLLQRSALVRVLPSGRLRSVDFHALSINGSALLNHAAVVYSADLGARASMPAGRGRALLVADGLGDLASARAELELVDAALADAGWQTTRLSGPEARPAAVLHGAGEADLFHFAGHARFQGELGWDSELKLADGSAVDVTDILTLEAAPALVVLSGCETARTNSELQPESVGLANAFLVAGSAGVIATARPVRDETAKRLVSHFYSAWTDGAPPHEALRKAQLMLRDAKPDSDWAAYRLIER